MIMSGTATQADVLRSERGDARRSLDLFDHPDERSRWQRETMVWRLPLGLAQWTLNDLEVKPARDSNVINVSHTSPTNFAAAVTNAFVTATPTSR